MRIPTAIVALLGLAVAAAAAVAERELSARFYYDLGKDTLDVSAYPKKQRENYAVFAKTCSQCHTLARPINSPIVTPEDWRRFVRRMHQNTTNKAGTRIGAAEAKRIVEFLAFDSRERKVLRKADFEAETQRLQERFKEVQAERQRRVSEQARENARSATDPANLHPEPSPGERR